MSDETTNVCHGESFPERGQEVLLSGRYLLTCELGRGAMGTVYRAEDQALGGLPVAIKRLPSVLAGDERALASLRAEAVLARRLSHPNIVGLRHFELTAQGPFLVLDLIEGEALAQKLARDGPLGEDEVVRLFRPLARALDHAHAEGVVHRDVKPSNILIRDDGRPLMSDFGIARELRDTVSRLTGLGGSGTLPYMSPEQLRGSPPTPAQDVYSLAATMYECVAGKPPFHRGDIAHQIQTSPPPSPEGASQSFSRAMMTGLAKVPDRRPKSCTNLVRLAMGGRRRERTSEVSRQRRSVARGVAWAIGLTLLLVAVVVAARWSWHPHGSSEARSDREVPEELTPDSGAEMSRLGASGGSEEIGDTHRAEEESDARAAHLRLEQCRDSAAEARKAWHTWRGREGFDDPPDGAEADRMWSEAERLAGSDAPEEAASAFEEAEKAYLRATTEAKVFAASELRRREAEARKAHAGAQEALGEVSLLVSAAEADYENAKERAHAAESQRYRGREEHERLGSRLLRDRATLGQLAVGCVVRELAQQVTQRDLDPAGSRVRAAAGLLESGNWLEGRDAWSMLERDAKAVASEFTELLSQANALTAFDEKGRSGLHRAARSDDVAAIHAWIRLGLPLDLEDDEGLTALHWAAWNGARSALDLLLDAGASRVRRAMKSPTEGDPLGGQSCAIAYPNALHLAAYAGRAAIVKRLLAAGLSRDLRIGWRDDGTG